jgi:molecular chaperone GrpE (heat shock protein)
VKKMTNDDNSDRQEDSVENIDPPVSQNLSSEEGAAILPDSECDAESIPQVDEVLPAEPTTEETPVLCEEILEIQDDVPEESSEAESCSLQDSNSLILDKLNSLSEAVEALAQTQSAREAELTARLGSFEKRNLELQEVLSKQVRWLTNQIEGLATTLAAPRLRLLLTDLLQVDDFLGRLLDASTKAEATADPPRYGIVLSKLRKVMKSHGVSVVPGEGLFDENLHEIEEVETTDCPDKHDTIKEVVRNGFRTETELLRPSHVVVWQYRPESTPAEDDCKADGCVCAELPTDAACPEACETPDTEPESNDPPVVGDGEE